MKLVDRRTGALVDVPDTDAAAAFKSGLYGIPKGAALPVATPGMVGTVDAKDAGQALSQGMTVPEEERFRKAQDETRYGGAGGAAIATGLGAVRGAASSFALPFDAIATEAAGIPNGFVQGREEIDPYRGKRTLSGKDVVREALAGYQRENPNASMAGELAGIAGAAYLGGGALGRVAAGAEAGAEAIGLGRLGTGALRGAAEGGFLSGVSAVNEAALGNSDLNAEKVVAGIGHGAFLGAGLGAGFAGLGMAKDAVRDAGGRFLARLHPADVDALAEKAFGYAPEGIGQRVQKAYAKAAAGVAGKDAEVVDKLTSLSPEGAEARRIAVYDAPKIQEEAQRQIREQIDGLLRSGDLVSAEARGALKADYVRKAVKTGNEAEVRAFGKNQISRIIDGVDAELAHADGVAPQMVKSLETTSRAAYRALEAIESGDNAAAFVEFDGLKRAMQRLAKNGTRSVQNIADPLEQLAARRSLDFVKGAAQELRAGLEDEALWGKAAVDQKVINGAWTKQLDASERFHRALTTETVRDPNDPYRRLRGADPAKVESYTKNLVNPNNDLTHTAVRDFVSSSRELSEAIQKSYDIPPEKAAEVARVRAASEAFQSTIARTEKSLVLANQFRELTSGTNDSLAAMLGTVGFTAGGLPGGIVGAGVGALANPGRTVAQLAAVERLLTKVDSRVGSSVRSFLRGDRRIGVREVPEAASPKGFEKMTKALSEAVDADGNITPAGQAKVADALGDLHESAPNLAVAVSGTAIRVSQFLASKLPPGMRNPFDLFPGDEPPLVSDTERETFARYTKAAQDPMSVLDRYARGDVTPEETEALRVCYPQLYAQVQQQIHEQITKAQAAGKPLDYEQRIATGVLFGTRTDATMDPAVLMAVAGARKKRKGGGSGAAAAPKMGHMRPSAGLAPRFMSTSEARSSRRRGGL